MKKTLTVEYELSYKELEKKLGLKKITSVSAMIFSDRIIIKTEEKVRI